MRPHLRAPARRRGDRGALLRQERAYRIRRGAGPGRGAALGGRGRRALLLLHAPGREACRVRQWWRREGPGAAHGGRAALAAGAARARPRGRRAGRGHLPRQRGSGAGGPGVIASVRGPVIVRMPGEVVVEAGGVGYRLAVSAETLRDVPDGGEEARLWTHLVIRDDSMQLYGFASLEERELFL